MQASGIKNASERYNNPRVAVNSISFGPPHVCHMGRACGEPNEIKNNTHQTNITALFQGRVPVGLEGLGHCGLVKGEAADGLAGEDEVAAL